MRHAIVQVPPGRGQEMVRKAREHGALSATWWPVKAGEKEAENVSLVIENRSVDSLLKRLSPIDETSVLLYPHEVLTFGAPAGKPPEELRDLEGRSPLEIFLLSLQSIGSWTSLLGYAAAGAFLTWIALYTNTVYLLIAGMLIAPFAGPAMNAALATATGDAHLLRRSLTQYAVGILATTVVAGLLSLAFQQDVVTELMTGVGYVSAAAVLLPLVAGSAGALNLIQSERSSLVSGTAVGLLVTASLAPPAALIGVASVMEEWPLVLNAVFQLALQLVGINLGGSLVFRQKGLVPSLRQYERGKQHVFYVSLALTVVALVGLLTWQFISPLRLERQSRSTLAAETIRSVIQERKIAHLVTMDARFENTDVYGENTLLADVYVERLPDDPDLTDAEIEEALRQAIQRTLQSENPQMAPLVEVIVLAPPPYTPMPQESAPD